jgi:hypothetical protein
MGIHTTVTRSCPVVFCAFFDTPLQWSQHAWKLNNKKNLGVNFKEIKGTNGNLIIYL